MENLGAAHSGAADSITLMRAGLAMVVVGHVNFLLGALVHGSVLRHISLRWQSQAAVYTCAHVAALVAGLMGIIVGVSTLIISRRKSKKLMCFLLWGSLLGGLLAAASVAGLAVTLGRAIAAGPHSLLAHCKVQDASGNPVIANECPFQPTRIYGTTIVLWVPLIVLCMVESSILGRNVVVCVSFLYFPVPRRASRRTIIATQVRVVSREELTWALWAEPSKQWEEPLLAGSSEMEAGTPEQPKLRSQFDRSSLWI
ncbi:transmembrane protein 54b isoform X1 [Brienomyrus brachyistius]|uniref:transmembrane protein 54b isoform X1 n=1 Tax=Brienomyrus brachyistius TaxID=42636 RepID=UPI0020B2E1FE|nr:transmembrane protein 54b isoform X1 [Brienomyrus brachyistius]